MLMNFQPASVLILSISLVTGASGAVTLPKLLLPNISFAPGSLPSNWSLHKPLATTPQAAVAAASDVPTPKKNDANATSAKSAVQLVRLRRREARPIGEGVAGKFFYTARAFVGQPSQALHFAMDTSSGQIILPTTFCSSPACMEHRRYQPEQSTFAHSITNDGAPTLENSTTRDAISIGFSNFDLGDGRVTGQLVADSLCLSADKVAYSHRRQYDDDKESAEQNTMCKNVGLVAATDLTDAPFRAAPFDGILGLGMQGLALSQKFSFIGMPEANATLGAPQALQQFALYHGSKFGEAAFGGHNPKRLASPLGWAPVINPGEGYWQVSITRIRVGNKTLNVCQDGNCRGILDSGTSSLGVPAKAMPEFDVALAANRQIGGGCGDEAVHLELSGGVELTLKAEDHLSGSSCGPSISSLDLPESFDGVFIFGEPVLRRYYTVYDWKQGEEQIGFGLAAASDAVEEASALTTEALEDLEDTRDTIVNNAAESQYGVVLMLLQAFFCRALVVICLVAVGTHISSGRALMTWIEGIMSNKSFLLDMERFAPAVPQNEAPDGDECVICLGSCEDDPAIAAGIPGLQQLPKVAEETGQCPCSSKSKAPRWRRLRCGHHFHEVCIVEWLRKSKHCPTCRRHFVKDSDTNDQVLPTQAFLPFS